ncbi:MAG: hypothetical protein ACI89X_004778 [Planctomycetota bacterium]|jgi:hypothetical protein
MPPITSHAFAAGAPSRTAGWIEWLARHSSHGDASTLVLMQPLQDLQVRGNRAFFLSSVGGATDLDEAAESLAAAQFLASAPVSLRCALQRTRALVLFMPRVASKGIASVARRAQLSGAALVARVDARLSIASTPLARRRPAGATLSSQGAVLASAELLARRPR